MSSTDTWVEIPEWVLSEACHQLDPMPRKRGDTTAVNTSLVQALLAYFEEGFDGCDHSVNICQCATASLVQELRLILDGKVTCAACGGDGHLWSQEKADKEGRRLEMEYGVGRFDYDTGSLGMYACPACNSTGATAL